MDQRPRYRIVGSSYLIGKEPPAVGRSCSYLNSGELAGTRQKWGWNKQDAKEGTRSSIAWTLSGAVKHLSTKYKQPTSKCQGALHASVRLVQSAMYVSWLALVYHCDSLPLRVRSTAMSNHGSGTGFVCTLFVVCMSSGTVREAWMPIRFACPVAKGLYLQYGVEMATERTEGVEASSRDGKCITSLSTLPEPPILFLADVGLGHSQEREHSLSKHASSCQAVVS